MKWVLYVPQIIETADDMSKEQLVDQLVKQQILHGAADTFTLEPIEEWYPNTDGVAETRSKIDSENLG
jgi:uncharacterized protein YjgD (DUF1641 family)